MNYELLNLVEQLSRTGGKYTQKITKPVTSSCNFTPQPSSSTESLQVVSQVSRLGEVQRVYDRVGRDDGGVVGLAHDHRDNVPPQPGPQLLGHVVLAEGVLEG